MRAILTEKGVSNGEEGTYPAKNVSLAHIMVTMTQAGTSVTERKMQGLPASPLTKGRTHDEKEGTTYAEKNVSDVENGVRRSGGLRTGEGRGLMII